MMRHVSCMAALCLSAWLSVGCGVDRPVSPADTSVIMPLTIGNRWVGRSTTYNPNGEIVNVEYDTVQIIREEVLKGERWFITNKNTAITNRLDGCWQSPGRPQNLSPTLVAKYPASARETFQHDTLEVIDPTGTIEDTVVANYLVASTDLAVRIPLGDYRCYQYRMELYDRSGEPLSFDAFNNKDDYYGYAPGVGPVIEEHYSMSPGGARYLWRRWELVDVTLR